MRYEERVRAYEEAKRAYDDAYRAWLAEQDPRPASKEDFETLECRYVMEHRKEAAALEALVTEVNVARAELERRWIAAHEDLAVLRKAGILQSDG